jgi:hydrogenase maturation protein HypF
LERQAVFHHHAHVAACLGEHLWPLNGKKVLAWALDGIGYAPNGQWWGGELLLVNYECCERVGGLPSTPLSGGDNSTQSPWRTLAAHLWRWYPDGLADATIANLFLDRPLTLLKNGLVKKIGCPEVSSMGRFFDAVAASLGLCVDGIDHEGQAAVQLMNLAESFEITLADPLEYPVPFEMQGSENQFLDLSHFWKNWLNIKRSNAEKAWLFHRILAKCLSNVVNNQCDLLGVDTVVFTGGVCHNRLLMRWVDVFLVSDIHCLRPNLLPSGDGGLAFGQLLIGLASQQQNENV